MTTRLLPITLPILPTLPRSALQALRCCAGQHGIAQTSQGFVQLYKSLCTNPCDVSCIAFTLIGYHLMSLRLSRVLSIFPTASLRIPMYQRLVRVVLCPERQQPQVSASATLEYHKQPEQVCLALPATRGQAACCEPLPQISSAGFRPSRAVAAHRTPPARRGCSACAASPSAAPLGTGGT